MKTAAECLPCFLRQSLQVAGICRCSPEMQFRLVQEVAALIASLDNNLSPPANAAPIYRRIAELTGCDDPYLEKKKASNQRALPLVSSLSREIAGSEGELEAAVRLAIAGNIIDYGAQERFDVDGALARGPTARLAVDHLPQLARAIRRLTPGSRVLYLADNCGEIVYDSLLLAYLHRLGLELTIAVKDGPIINDALVEDALEVGLDRFGRLITSSGRVPGTELAQCSPQFVELFFAAELVIAKGQGNFECLSEVKRDIFFLLTVKCAVAARHLAELSGVGGEELAGSGEMAVFYSGYKG